MNHPQNSQVSWSSRPLILFYLATIFFWGSVYVYMPILSPYVNKVGGSLQAVGLVMGAYGLSQFLLRVPLGLLSDRWRRRKPFILLGFVMDGAACIGLIFADSTLTLFLSVLAAGIASSMWVAFTVLFSSYFPLSLMSQSMGVILFCTRISQVLSNYAGGSIAEAWGWTAPFYAGLIIAVTGFIWGLGIKEVRAEPGSAFKFHKLLSVGRSPELLIVSIFALLLQFGICGTTYGFTPIYALQLGATKKDLGILLFIFMVPATLSTLSSGFLTRWLNPGKMLFAAFLFLSLAIFSIPWVDRLPLLYALQAVAGISAGLVFPILMGIAITPVPEEQQGTAMGFFQSIYAAGMSLGPIVSGWVGQHFGFSSIFILSGGLCLLAAFSALKVIK